MKPHEMCKLSSMAFAVLTGISFVVTIYEFFTTPSIYIMGAFFTTWFMQFTTIFAVLNIIYNERDD